MLSLEQAQEQILSQLTPLPAEVIPLAQTAGRIIRQEILSLIDLPRFDNSAMDGYAVRSADLKNGSIETPVRLLLAGKVAAGENASREVHPGECLRIFTGSPLPPGADAVVMQEDVELDGHEVLFREPVKLLENIRLRGEDVRAGAHITTSGQKITAPLIGLLSACGVGEVSVGKAPRIALLATGNELREPGVPLEPGEIYESNRAMLAPAIAAAGGIARICPLVPDALKATTQALDHALSECNAVITSGGVSVGEFDFVKAALNALGGQLDFWRVAIKPGKPFVFGQCRGKFIFGLPGNPVSAWVTFLLLVRPALLKLQGASDCMLPRVFGTLAERISNRGDRRHFVRVHLDPEGNVNLSGPQASHMLGGLGHANGLVDVPPESSFEKDEQVPVLLWENSGS